MEISQVVLAACLSDLPSSLWRSFLYAWLEFLLLQVVAIASCPSAVDLLEKSDSIFIIPSYFSWWQQLDPFSFLFLDLHVYNSPSCFLYVICFSFLTILVALSWTLASFSTFFLYLDAILLMQSKKSWREGNNHFPLMFGLCGWVFYMLSLASGMLACRLEIQDRFLVILNCHCSIDSKMTKTIYMRWRISSWSDETKMYFGMSAGAEPWDYDRFHWNQCQTFFDVLYMLNVS